MKELRWLREEPKSHAFFFYFYFYFYFYHVFIVSRYKKLRAALAMERTKPINQNKQQKKPPFLVHRVFTENTWAKTICPSFPTKTKYKEITTLKLLLIYAFFARKDI